jgi:hypothetical protein
MMSIQGIGAFTTPGSVTSSGGTTSKNQSQSGDDAVQAFDNYMKETPAQRMEDAWLAAHNITKEQLAAMTPQQRAGIMKQMATDIKNQIEKKLGTGSSTTTTTTTV